MYGSRMFYYAWDVPIFCVMGAMGGLMGALWVHVNVRVTLFRHRFIPVRSNPSPPTTTPLPTHSPTPSPRFWFRCNLQSTKYYPVILGSSLGSHNQSRY